MLNSISITKHFNLLGRFVHTILVLTLYNSLLFLLDKKKLWLFYIIIGNVTIVLKYIWISFLNITPVTEHILNEIPPPYTEI